jgi:hypothetical protein
VSRPTPALTSPSATTASPLRAARVVGSLILGVAALILGALAALPWLVHRHALDWPVVAGEVRARSVMTQYVNRKGPSYVVRDTYRVPGPNGPTICYWEDPLGTGIRSWIDARLKTRESYWPVGSPAAVRAEPYGDRCEPVAGFERAVRPTVAVVALAALACLGGLAFLWRPKTPVR